MSFDFQNARRAALARTLRGGAGLAGWAMTASSAWSAAPDPTAKANKKWPDRPVQLIVPWSAGGPTDFTLRELARAASQAFGEQVVVENKPGGGGVIAVNTLLAGQPDGHLVMQLPVTVYRLPYLQKLSWDPLKVLEPLMQVSEVGFGVFVRADSAIRSWPDLLEYGRRHPGDLTIGSTGVTSTPNLVMEELLGGLGIEFIPVPFRGAIEQVYAVQARTVVAGVSSSGFADLVDQGELRLLATLDAERSKRWPDVPTLKELGHDVVATSPYGLAVLRGTPPEILERLRTGFHQAVFDPLHVAALRRYDQEVVYLDQDDFQSELNRIAQREARWARELRRAEGAGGRRN